MKKKLSITVGTNSLTVTQQPAYSNHNQVWFRLGRNHPNIRFMYSNPPRMSIDRMRNMSAEVMLASEFDYLLFLDDDVLVPVMADGNKDWLDKLLACDADISAGDVLVRGYPFNHMAFRWDKSRIGLYPIKNWKKSDPIIAPVDAVGFSLALIKASLIKKIDKPYFVTGLTNTEDIYFCIKARQADPKCKIVIHREVVCQHLLWPEPIGPENVKQYRKYYEEYYGGVEKPEKDRGGTYLKIVKGVLDK